MKTLEGACQDTEQAATVAGKAGLNLSRAARAVQRAACAGDTSKIRKALESLDAELAVVIETTRAARASWQYSDDEITNYLESSFATELMAAAQKEGLRLERLEDHLSAFPVIVQVLAKQRAVRLGKVKSSSLRPRNLVAEIKRRHRAAGTKPEQFIEILYRCYSHLVGDKIGKGVELLDIYSMLTILPEAKRSYQEEEFGRDLFLLESSSTRRTQKGARVEFPAATGTRGSKSILVVAPDGARKRYFGLRFVQEEA